MLLKIESRRARSIQGQGWGLFGQSGQQIILYASIFQAGRLTLLVFLLSNCVSPFPLSGPFMSRRIITHPKNNIKAELFFLGNMVEKWRYLLCGMHSALLSALAKMLFMVIEKDWLPSAEGDIKTWMNMLRLRKRFFIWKQDKTPDMNSTCVGFDLALHSWGMKPITSTT